MEEYYIFASSTTICDVNDLRYNLSYGKRRYGIRAAAAVD
jgi:hypothetical protein